MIQILALVWLGSGSVGVGWISDGFGLSIGVLRERLLLLVLLNLGLNRLRDRDGRRLTRWLGKGAKAELRRWQVGVDAHRRRHLDRLARVVD